MAQRSTSSSWLTATTCKSPSPRIECTSHSPGEKNGPGTPAGPSSHPSAADPTTFSGTEAADLGGGYEQLLIDPAQLRDEADDLQSPSFWEFLVQIDEY